MGVKKRITKKCGNRRRAPKRSCSREGRKKDLRKVQQLINRTGKEKGLRSEEFFMKAFEGLFWSPFWFVCMRRATLAQDKFEGTDFVLETIFKDEVRFDVKSSKYGYDKQIETTVLKKIHVWPIIIDPTMSLRSIRRLVFSMAKRQIDSRRAASGLLRRRMVTT